MVFWCLLSPREFDREVCPQGSDFDVRDQNIDRCIDTCIDTCISKCRFL